MERSEAPYDGQPSPDSGSDVGSTSVSRRALLRGALAGGAVLSANGLLPVSIVTGADRAAGPQRGGRLRVGMVGGGSSETLNPNNAITEIDIARAHSLYERLVEFHPDGSLYNQLAEDISHNADGTVWTIKVRPHVQWHDGSLLTADDVVYSLRYILDPANKAQGAADIAYLKPNNIQQVDGSTVKIRLDQPLATLPTSLSSRALYIFKTGTKTFDRPVGTGPFKIKSWTRGERSLFVRHDGYRAHGGPYLDEVEIISIDDPTTRLNSLSAGQIDAMAFLDLKLVATVKANPNLRLLEADTGGYPAQFMQVDRAPFNDNRVRQAFRLMVDRHQIVNTALLGYAKLGNDLACPFDPDYASEIPQRPYDPEKAKFLLKQAGREGLTASLYTGDVSPGVLDSSVLLVEQAKKAGVTITLNKDTPSQYWSDKYMKLPFECTYWGQRPLDSQIAQALNAKGPFNETNWHRPAFDKITDEARRTLDPKKRHDLWVEAQRVLWNEGGYIIWGFPKYIDATSAKVHGITPSSARPLGWYTFGDAYLA